MGGGSQWGPGPGVCVCPAWDTGGTQGTGTLDGHPGGCHWWFPGLPWGSGGQWWVPRLKTTHPDVLCVGLGEGCTAWECMCVCVCVHTCTSLCLWLHTPVWRCTAMSSRYSASLSPSRACHSPTWASCTSGKQHLGYKWHHEASLGRGQDTPHPHPKPTAWHLRIRTTQL